MSKQKRPSAIEAAQVAWSFFQRGELGKAGAAADYALDEGTELARSTTAKLDQVIGACVRTGVAVSNATNDLADELDAVKKKAAADLKAARVDLNAFKKRGVDLKAAKAEIAALKKAQKK